MDSGPDLQGFPQGIHRRDDVIGTTFTETKKRADEVLFFRLYEDMIDNNLFLTVRDGYPFGPQIAFNSIQRQILHPPLCGLKVYG